MQEIEVQPASLEQLGEVLLPGRADTLRSTASRARSLLAGRVVWNINATAHGGGVAEMLQGLLAYGRGAGVDTGWLVLDADPEFFAITNRIHNAPCTDRGTEPDWRPKIMSTTTRSWTRTWQA